MFGWTRIVTLAAVAAMLAMATGVAGATSKPGSAPAAGSHMASAGKISTAAAGRAALLKAANLRTKAGAARYLRAIGVNPRHLVIQRGIRNYAGAKCPGTGWSCTSTAHPVIQIAAAGGSNTFQCSTASCAVVQATTAPTANTTVKDKATCIKTTGLTGSCSISQTTGATNQAIVVQTTSKMSGLTQTASYNAQITQLANGSNTNTACVYQDVGVDGSTTAKRGVPVTVTLNAHQSISITQDATGSGSNTVKGSSLTGDCSVNTLTQKQTLTSTATGSASITQNENATDTGPNLKLEIAQNQGSGSGGASGPNTATFAQTNTLTAIANTPAGPVTQTQSSLNGGLSATVNQFSSAKSTAVANQTETQCEHAAPSGAVTCTTGNQPVYSLTQVQHGPLRKDSPSIQSGNSTNEFTVNQSSIQNTDTGSTQTNVMEGACTTSGNCTSTQDTNVNGTPTHNTQTGSDVDTQINCTGSACTPSGGVVSLSPTGLSISNTDVGEFGYGGMRGSGTGSIAVSGITAPVTGAFLYWNGPTNSADPASNASVTFNGTGITGTNIGTASDNNWGFQNSQSYRADVTSLVAGNGTYSLSNFLKGSADINGVSLIVFYNDGSSSNDRNVVAWNGNDSNLAFGADPADWDETISGVSYPGSGTASLDLVVSDGQSFADGALVVNGSTVAGAGPIFQGDSTPPGVTDGLWDVESFDITSLLTAGSNSLHLTSAANGDALSLVVAIANVPASAPVIL
jgi:hypothetical protein